jgi:signal transduction histidine kinase
VSEREPHRALLRPLPSMRAWYALASGSLVVGLASIGLLVGLQRARDRRLRDDVAISRAAIQIRAELATSHVWLEEYSSGDRVSTEDFWRGIRRSLVLLDAMIGGAEVREGPWRVRAVADPQLDERARALRQELSRLAAVTLERQTAHDRGDPAAAGSILDVAYDHQFHDLMDQAVDLQAAVEDRLTIRIRRLDSLFYGVLAAWAAVVAVTFAGLRRFEERRLRSETVLRDREMDLLRAQKMEAVARLAGGVAHDINNVLAAIRAQAEIVQRKPLGEGRLREKMDAVIASVERASGMIHQLLAFARRQPIRPQPVNLNRVVERWRGTLEQTLGEKVSLETALDPALWDLDMDPVQVEQVVLNLVVNAREAMPCGGSLRIETANRVFCEGGAGRPVSEPGDYVVLTVSDSGPGIPPELLDRIFEPFFTTREERGNSGLGLATVYGIVKQNAGNVWASNSAQGGAQLRVYLPRSRAAEPVGERKPA